MMLMITSRDLARTHWGRGHQMGRLGLLLCFAETRDGPLVLLLLLYKRVSITHSDSPSLFCVLWVNPGQARALSERNFLLPGEEAVQKA